MIEEMCIGRYFCAIQHFPEFDRKACFLMG
jgi:hypothetical protein